MGPDDHLTFFHSDELFAGLKQESRTYEGLRVALLRGTGPTARYSSLLVSLKELEAVRNQAGALVERIVHHVRQTLWLWDRPSGMAVAQIGKWRKWGRAA